jgi:multidrug resistance efflux pump
MGSFSGKVTADICEARFAFSGKVVSIHKRAGDTVNKGEILASLDRKLLQTELDRQLADYEKTRADWDAWNTKNPDPSDDLTKFTKQSKQAQLNASVKDVELAKYQLDQTDLVCPVNGIIIDTSGMAPGLNIAPASSTIRIVNKESLRFLCEVPTSDIAQLLNPTHVRVRIQNGREYSGTTVTPASGTDGKIFVYVNLDDTSGLISGMSGDVSL